MTEETQGAGEMPAPPDRALAWMRQATWAIEPTALETILAIARREISDPEFKALEAVHARVGVPLEGTRRMTVREGGVAVMGIKGPIFRYGNIFTSISGAASIDAAALDFAAAVENPAVSSIVLVLDSPGGEVSGIHEFARMVQAARDKKPVVAYVSDKAASAAYWIAAAAERVVMDATASVGSIGVVARVMKNGDQDVVEVVSKQSPHKRPDIGTDVGRAQVQSHVDRIAQIFVDNVAEFRGVDAETVLAKFGQGGLLVGSDAVEAGMADSLGSLELLIAGMTGKHKESRHMTKLAEGAAPAVTREYIAENHPAIAAAFRDEGKTAGAAEGATAERARIQGVLSKKRPGHEKLVEQLAFDGKTTPDQAAAQILDAMTASDKAKLDATATDANALQTPAGDPPKSDKEKENADAAVKSPSLIAARAREITAEKAKLGIHINAAQAYALAEKE